MPSTRPPRQPLDRAKARNCALINQFATPGLGSLIGGRRFEGIGQLILAVAGVLMVVGWFVHLTLDAYHQIMTGATESSPRSRLGPAGGITFVVAWLWSLVTSLSLLREARRNDGEKPA